MKLSKLVGEVYDYVDDLYEVIAKGGSEDAVMWILKEMRDFLNKEYDSLAKETKEGKAKDVSNSDYREDDLLTPI